MKKLINKIRENFSNKIANWIMKFITDQVMIIAENSVSETIEQLSSQFDEFESDIDQLRSDVDDASYQMEETKDLRNDVNDLEYRIDDTEREVSDNADRIEDLENKINNGEEKENGINDAETNSDPVKNLDTKLVFHNLRISAIEKKLENDTVNLSEPYYFVKQMRKNHK